MTRITYIPNRVIDSDGIADGAAIYVYQTGGTTPVSLFSDSAFTVSVTNPYVVTTGASVPTLYTNYSDNIRVRVVSSDGEVPFDEDPYDVPDVGLRADLVSTASGKGAALVNWIRSVSGAVSRTVLAWLTNQPYMLEDFGGGPSATAAANDAAWALLKAVIGGSNTKSTVQFADGTYQTALGFDLPSAAHQIILQGRGKGKTVIKCTDATKHIITLPTTGTPHSIILRDLTLDGSATAANTGNGVHHGGSNDFFGFTLENVNFDNIANNCFHVPDSAFTFRAVGCNVNTTYGHGFYGGGNTWKFDTCYIHTLHTALKAGFRITGGTVVFDNCNGVDSGSIWADLGMSTVAAETPDGVVDAAAGYCRATFTGCNLEDFSAHGIWVRGGSINLNNTAFVAPSTGTVTAISGQYGNSQGGFCDRHPATMFTTKGASWTNSLPIHSRSALPPFGLIATNSNSAANTYSFYNDAGATAVVMPVVRSRQINSTRMAHELKDLYVSGQLKTDYNGTATLAAGTASVVFGTARTSATYRILLSGDTAETFTWASKSTTGFTINSSNAGSTANVDWFVVE